MALLGMDGLEGAALDYAEAKGYGVLEVDSNGWTLLHHAASESQHRRGMLEVIRGLLAVMPIDVVDQKTGGGTPHGWSALSIVCNARDWANERAGIAQLLVEKGADLEATNHHGTTALMTACACGNWSCVRALLDARANPFATNIRGKNALDVTPEDQWQVV